MNTLRPNLEDSRWGFEPHTRTSSMSPRKALWLPPRSSWPIEGVAVGDGDVVGCALDFVKRPDLALGEACKRIQPCRRGGAISTSCRWRVLALPEVISMCPGTLQTPAIRVGGFRSQ
jgi:hypothetical protein